MKKRAGKASLSLPGQDGDGVVPSLEETTHAYFDAESW
jgi:hypothetical protein